MPFIVPITYSQVFNEPMNSFLDSLKNFDITRLIKRVLVLNSMLYFYRKNLSEVHELALHWCNQALTMTSAGREIKRCLDSKELEGTKLIFNEDSMAFVFLILLKHSETILNESSVSDELSIDEQLVLLKIALVANEMSGSRKKYSEQTQQTFINEKDKWRAHHWPILLSQKDCNTIVSFSTEIIKTKKLLDSLVSSSELKQKAVNEYLKKINCQNVLSYIVFFTNIFTEVQLAIQKKDYIVGFPYSSENMNFFEELCINNVAVDIYNKKTIKEYPLYKQDNMYYVINWNYFALQIYVGTFMGLKKHLPKEISKNLKKESGELMESEVFVPVIEHMFSSIWTKHLFEKDLKNKNSKPDAMVQAGNNLYIFEFKDSLMRDDVFESDSNKVIKDYLRVEFVGSENKRKGVTQLTDYIEHYYHGLYKDDYFPYNSSLKIYPILIYTDYRYGTSGFNDFLLDEFNKYIEPLQAEMEQKSDKRGLARIQPLTFIDLSFLINNIDSFRNKEIRLNKMIDSYHKNNRKLEQSSDLEFLKISQKYPTFERFHHRYDYVVAKENCQFDTFMKLLGIHKPQKLA